MLDSSSPLKGEEMEEGCVPSARGGQASMGKKWRMDASSILS